MSDGCIFKSNNKSVFLDVSIIFGNCEKEVGKLLKALNKKF